MLRFSVSGSRWITFTLGALLLSAAALFGQSGDDLPLRLQGPTPTGARATVTEAWTTLQFTVENPNASGREARVAVYYPEAPDVQYARDVWVPGRASLTTWLTVGPAPTQKSEFGRELRTVFRDRTGGADRLILPKGEERVRTSMVVYRRREQTTTLMVDLEPPELGQPDPGVPPDLLTLARLPRTEGHSEHISVVRAGPLPLATEALDGIDVFVLAGNRLADDPPGRVALRHWVERGGRLWVMLDRVDPDVVAAILGDGGAVGVVDRVGLTRLDVRVAGTAPIRDAVREVDRPVPFVRAVAGAGDTVLATVDGWPAAFVRRMGRGKIVFTALGADGWSRPRVPRDGASPFPGLREFPVPLAWVAPLTRELHPPNEPDPYPPDVFQPMLAEEIGYEVVGRGTVAAILIGFVLTIAALGFGLRRPGRPTLFAGLVLLSASSAAVALVALGERKRQAIPPTVGVAALVDPIPGTDESIATGLYAVYRPSSGSATVGTDRGAILGLDAEGLEGQTRIRVQTDIDAWHWDGLSFPAGSRIGTFRTTLETGRIAAVARYGPAGIEGELAPGSYGGLSDAILARGTRDAASLRLAPDGAFASGTDDILPGGQYLGSSLLTDRQQRRLAVYTRLLGGSGPKHLEGRDLLLVWADSPDAPILRGDGVRVVGNVLLAVPLEFERTAPDTPVNLPRGSLPYKRIQDGQTLPVTMKAPFAADMRLRFQLPPAVLPLRVEGATLSLKVRAPFRRITVSGERDGTPLPLFAGETPVEAIRIAISDPAMLKPDDQGGLHLRVAIGSTSAGAATDSEWIIETLSLEATGRTAPR